MECYYISFRGYYAAVLATSQEQALRLFMKKYHFTDKKQVGRECEMYKVDFIDSSKEEAQDLQDRLKKLEDKLSDPNFR